MVVTDYNEQFLDKRGTDHLIDELKAYADGIASGNIDLSNYVTKEELQAKLDALDINIDLSSYATKEELTNAINSIDLSAYALKTEIPSLDGYATTEYVDNAIANVPSGGNVDLSNYYTKAETYSKTEVDIKVAEAGGSSVPILPMEDWIELNTQYDENINFQSKKVYFDTSIAFKNLLKDKTYRFYLYDNKTRMNYVNYVQYENGVLKFIHANETKVDLDGQSGTSVSFRTSYLYDKTQSNGEWTSGSLYGKWINGWKSLSEDFIENTEVNNVCLCGNVFRLGNGISSPNFGYKDMEADAYDIDGKELYHALLKSIIKIVDENGNEIAFKTVPTQEDYLEYVNNLSGGGGTADLSNYYTKDEVYTKAETDALIPTVTNGVDGVSPTVSITETNNGHTVSITDKNGTQSFDVTNGSNGIDGTNGTNGTDGYTPVRGTDYWTQEDINTIKAYIDTELGVIENGSY